MSSSIEVQTRPGRFITLEGGEGAGKSTQVRALLARLTDAGIAAITTREPGGTPRAERYRAALLDGAIAPFGPAAEALVFCAARIDHLDQRIAPALAAGTTVICDRFMDSTRAYQGALGHLDTALVDGLERVVVGSLRPDLTLILDLPPQLGLARAAARRGGDGPADRFEREGEGFHDALRQAFRAIVAAEPDRCRLIDAARDADIVAQEIWTLVSARFGFHSSVGADATLG